MDDQNESKASLRSWLGFSNQLDFTKAKILGSFLGICLSIFAIVYAVAIVILIVLLLTFLILAIGSNEPNAIETTQKIALALAGLIGVPFLIWRTILLDKQVVLTSNAQFNDRFNLAAKELVARRETTRIVETEGVETVLKEWEDDLAIRVSAIDQLQALAFERNEIAPRVVRMLAAYIRSNFAAHVLDFHEQPFAKKIPRLDLQKVIDAIGVIHPIAIATDPSHWRLDLKSCDFDGVSFRKGNFFAADFRQSRFEYSDFEDANCDGCIFSGSLLNFAHFRGANLRGVRFDQVILNRNHHTSGLFALAESLEGAIFIGADISALTYLGEPKVIEKTFGTKDTSLYAKHRLTRPSIDDHESYTIWNGVPHEQILETLKPAISRVEDSGFKNWSPYDQNETTTWHLLSEFREKLNMNKWPYV